MSLTDSFHDIEYPESDGMPVGETDVHIDWIFRIRDILRLRYRGQRVYVASDLLLYYVEGQPAKFVVPDGFVVKNCEAKQRRTFKTWEEGKTPDVAFEVTSKGSRRDDEMWKPQIYARLGIKEYFLYDPTSEYLDPPLRGFRLQAGEYGDIEPDAQGRLNCEELGISLELLEGKLVMHDQVTGKVLLTEAEAERVTRREEVAAREQERAARQAEETGRLAAEQRVAQLEVEVRRLREQLKQARGEA